MLCLSVAASAQVIFIADRISTQPVENAMVMAPGLPALFTNQNGNVNITSLANAKEIVVSCIGYNRLITNNEQIKKNGYTVFLRPSAYTFDEFVLSPTRFNEKRSDVPQKIEVLKASEMAFSNQPTLAEVLSNSGQLFVQKSQMGGGSPVIRGFEASRVLMVVDGIRLNNAIYRAGHLQNVITVDNNVLDKTEIFYGPGSVSYGSDALGGVMHFYTKGPKLASPGQKRLNAGAAVRYGSAAQEKMTHLEINAANDKWGSFTSFTFSDFGDLKTGTRRDSIYGDWGKKPFYVDRINNRDTVMANADENIQTPTGYAQFDVLQKVLYRPDEKTKHLLNFQFSTSTNVPRYDRLTQLRNGLPRFAEWYYGPQKRLLLAYVYDRKLSTRLADDVKVTLAGQRIEESRHDRSFRNDLLRSRIERVNYFTLNIDVEKRLKKDELSYGLDAGYNNVNSKAFTTNVIDYTTGSLDTRYPDGGSQVLYTALFATHKREFSRKWILSDGLRLTYNQLNARFNSKTFFPFPFNEISQKNLALNGNAGVVYKPNMWWKISGVVASGFRAPNVDDLSKVFESVRGSVIVPDPNLKPEYTYNADLSVSRLFADNSLVSVTGFYTRYINAITLQKSTFNGADSILYDGVISAVQTTTNAGSAWLTGASARLNIELTDRFRLLNDLTYTYGRLVTDSTPYPLDHIPPMYGRSCLQYQQKKFQAELFVLFNGWKKVKDYNMLGEDNFGSATKDGTPAWSTLNLRIGYQATKGLQLQAGCENIFDKHYRYFASGVSAPGRNIFITIRGNF